LRTGAAAGVTRDAATIREASKRWMPLGERIVVLGGELVGLELAEFLAHRGRQVTVLESASRPGAGLPIVRRWRVLAELKRCGVTILPNAGEFRISSNAVSYVNWRRQVRTLACDHVIIAMGAKGDTTLANALQGAGFSVHEAGDCRGVGYIDGAMRSAAEVAQLI